MSAKQIRRLKRSLATGTLILATWSFATSTGRSQQAAPDLSAPLLTGAECVSSSSQSTYYSRLNPDDARNVSVSRELHTSIFSMQARAGNQTTLTCRVDPAEFSTLDLQFGVSDDDVETNSLMTINIYQGGNVLRTYSNVASGRLITSPIDLSGSASVAIELRCERTNRPQEECLVYFFDAQLIPPPAIGFPSDLDSPSNQVVFEEPSQPQAEQPASPNQSDVYDNGSDNGVNNGSDSGNNGSILQDAGGVINEVNQIRQRLGDLLGF
jgi:hypothetical protein